jgi:hypothetical protein
LLTGVAPQASGLAGSLADTLVDALAVALPPIAPPPALETGLRARLLSRVARSAAANQPFHTVRQGEGQVDCLAPGVRATRLYADAVSQSAVICCDADASWLPPTGEQLGEGCVMECFVLAGELRLGEHTLGPQDYLLLPVSQDQARALPAPEQSPWRWHAKAGTRLYWRHCRSVAGAHQDAVAPAQVVRGGEGGWVRLRQGVKIKRLGGQGEAVSMLAHFEPGAGVPAHPHSVGEECLMVQGDLFLGDLLLREGEFQHAPVGSGHGALFSDVGCVLYFHGAVDPAAADPAVYGQPC